MSFINVLFAINTSTREFSPIQNPAQKDDFINRGFTIVTDTELVGAGFIGQEEACQSVVAGHKIDFGDQIIGTYLHPITSVTPLTEEEIAALSEEEQREINVGKVKLAQLALQEIAKAKLTDEEKVALGLT